MRVVGDRVPRHLDAAVAAEQPEHHGVGVGRAGVRRGPVVPADALAAVRVRGDAGAEPVVVGVRWRRRRAPGRCPARGGSPRSPGAPRPAGVGPLRAPPPQLVQGQPVAHPRDGEGRVEDPAAGTRIDVEALGDQGGDEPGALADAREDRPPKRGSAGRTRRRRPAHPSAAGRSRGRRPGRRPARWRGHRRRCRSPTAPGRRRSGARRGSRRPGPPGTPRRWVCCPSCPGRTARATAAWRAGPGSRRRRGRVAPSSGASTSNSALYGYAALLVDRQLREAGDRLARVDDAVHVPAVRRHASPDGERRGWPRRGDREPGPTPGGALAGTGRTGRGRTGHAGGSGVRRARRRTGAAPSSAR